MTNKQPEKEQEHNLSWEEAVSRYLEQNPEYFANHPEVLERLQIPHVQAGGAASLIERQVFVLRENNHAISTQLQNLIAIARDNERLNERLHQFVLILIKSGSLAEVLENSSAALIHDFGLEHVVVCLSDPEAAIGLPESLAVGDDQFDELVAKAFGGSTKEVKPIYGSQDETGLASYLFGDRLGEIGSYALIPLGANSVTGVLALGSANPERFGQQLGKSFLTKFGELLFAAVDRYRS